MEDVLAKAGRTSILDWGDDERDAVPFAELGNKERYLIGLANRRWAAPHEKLAWLADMTVDEVDDILGEHVGELVGRRRLAELSRLADERITEERTLNSVLELCVAREALYDALPRRGPSALEA